MKSENTGRVDGNERRGAESVEPNHRPSLLALRSVLVVLLLLVSNASATTIRLRNGTLLSGEITAHDEKGFTLTRLDNGGVVTIAWTQLDPEEATRVQDLLKLPEEKEELMIEGSRLLLDDGSSIEGKIVEDKPDLVVIKTPNGNRQVPRGRIEKVESVQIPALSFCTAQELYAAQARSLDPEDAKAQFAMGQYCIRVKLFDKAKQHFEAALALDPAMEREIRKRLALIQRVAKESEAQALRDQAMTALAAQKFDEALAAAKKLASEHGGTAAGRDAEDLVKRITDEQRQYASNKDQYLGGKVVDEWFDQVDTLLRKAATERTLTLAAAKKYVDQTLATDVKLQLAEKLKIDAETIESAWRSRQVARPRTASYMDGTWIHDGVSIRRPRENQPTNLEEQQEREKNDPVIDAEQKKLALDLSKAGEIWWAKASAQSKMSWLRAYNAERNLQVIEVKYDPCAKCKGKGLLGGSKLCDRCYGTLADRVVIYK